MERGLWGLDSDEDILEMCELLPPSRMVYVYAITTKPLLTVTPNGVVRQTYAPL